MNTTGKSSFITGALLGLCLFVTSISTSNCSSDQDVPGRDATFHSAARSEYVRAAIFQLRNPAAITRDQLLADLHHLIDATSGIYGIYIYEFDSGQGFGINERMSFEGASTVKLPVLMLLFKEIEAGSASMDETMTYTWSDFEEGTGSIQQSGIGSTWTIAELAEKMMQESDNVAKNMLFRRLGLYAVEDYAIDMGAEDFDLINNRVTPCDMGLLLRLIYENKVVAPGLTGEILALMTDTLHEQRIPRYLEGVPAAHKIGTLGDSVSDIGIIFADNSPFVLCVYSEGVASEAVAEETIGRIAWSVTNYEVLRKYQEQQP